MSRERLTTIVRLLALPLVCGCNASYPFQPSNPVPTTLQIHYQNPMGPALVGQSFGFNAYVVNSDGGIQDVTTTATWMSSNTNVIRLIATPSGFTAIAPGLADVSATYRGISNALPLTVMEADRQFPILVINLVNSGLGPPTPPRVVGQTAYLSAAIRINATQSQSVTTQATWSSSDPRVMTVLPEGQLATLRAIGAGTAVITASFNGLTATYGLSIQP